MDFRGTSHELGSAPFTGQEHEAGGDCGAEPTQQATTDPNKAALKRRRLTGDSLTRRKRNAVACRFCRVRKAKCDNTRPVCGFCVRHKAKCIYDDGGEVAQYDDASQTILERLDELKQLLQSRQGNDQPQARPSPVETPTIDGWPRTPSVSSPTVEKHPTVNSSNGTHMRPRFPLAAIRCESLLKWPVFRGVVTRADSEIDSFILDLPDDPSMIPSSQPALRSRYNRTTSRDVLTHGIQEDSLVPLCRKFLAYIHPRNPILEADDLLVYAKSAAENGIRWDAPSCLVVSDGTDARVNSS